MTNMTIPEILKDHSFIDALSLTIKVIKKERDDRPLPPIGCKYKRDWIDRLEDSNNFNVSFFLQNIEPVLSKKSNLYSEARSVVEYIFRKTFLIYIKSKE